MRCNLTIKRELGQDLRGSCQQQQPDQMNANAWTTGGRVSISADERCRGVNIYLTIPTGESGSDRNTFSC